VTGAAPYRPATPMPSTPDNWQDVRRPQGSFGAGSVGPDVATIGRDYPGVGGDDRRGPG